MNLDIRRVPSGNIWQKPIYSLSPPEKQVDDTIVHDFHLVIVSLAEALHLWADESVSRVNGSNRWSMQTASRRHLLTMTRKGSRLYIMFREFEGHPKTFLEEVAKRVSLNMKLQEYAEEMERRSTNRIEIPLDVVEEWIRECGFAPGKMLHVGADPKLTPPPLPHKPIYTPAEDD